MKTKHLERISIDPNVCFGKPCIRGHRIWVSLILDMLTEGMTIEELLEDYPQLVVEDIYACLAYGAEMARERYVEVNLDSESHPDTRIRTVDRSDRMRVLGRKVAQASCLSHLTRAAC